MVVLLVNVLRNLHSVFHSGCTSLPFPSAVRVPFSPHLHQYLSFDSSHSNSCQGYLTLWFWFTFSDLLMMLSIFSLACSPFVYLLCRNICADPLPIFWPNLGFCCSVVGVSFYILNILHLTGCKDLGSIFSIPVGCFCTLDYCVLMDNIFMFNIESICQFLFWFPVLFVVISAENAKLNIIRFSPVFCFRVL